MGAASGKKAQAAAALQEALAAAEAQIRMPPHPPSADGPRATLIVCPLSVLSNWQTQIEEHTAGNLQVTCPVWKRRFSNTTYTLNSFPSLLTSLKRR